MTDTQCFPIFLSMVPCGRLIAKFHYTDTDTDPHGPNGVSPQKSPCPRPCPCPCRARVGPVSLSVEWNLAISWLHVGFQTHVRGSLSLSYRSGVRRQVWGGFESPALNIINNFPCHKLYLNSQLSVQCYVRLDINEAARVHCVCTFLEVEMPVSV